MSSRIPRIRVPAYSRQRERLLEALDAGALATGPHLGAVRDRLEDRFGCGVALTGSGFQALEVVLRVYGEESDVDTVAVPAAGTCFALPNATQLAGLVPRLVDIGPEWGPAGTEGADAVVVPHLFGHLAPVPGGTPVIEDAAQSFLSIRGVSTSSLATVFSFYPTKGINGVAGGAIASHDAGLIDACREAALYADQSAPGGRPRGSAGMTNLNAAFLLGTLESIEVIEAGYREAAEVIRDELETIASLQVRVPDRHEVPTRIVCRTESRGVRDAWIDTLNALGVSAGREFLRLWSDESPDAPYPVADAAVATTLSLPFWSGMTSDELRRLTTALRRTAAAVGSRNVADCADATN